MKLTYQIDTLKSITNRVYEGNLNKENLTESLRLFWSDPGYKLRQNHVLDFRKANLNLTTSDVVHVASIVVANVQYHDRIVSFLVAKPQEAAITAMYKELSQHKHISGVFVSERKALEFIGAPSDFLKTLNPEEAKIIQI